MAGAEVLAGNHQADRDNPQLKGAERLAELGGRRGAHWEGLLVGVPNRTVGERACENKLSQLRYLRCTTAAHHGVALPDPNCAPEFVMRSPLLRLAAGLLLLAGCGKKKDGPTYMTGSLDVAPAADAALLASIAPAAVSVRTG